MSDREPSFLDLRVFAVGQAVCVAGLSWLLAGCPDPLPAWWMGLASVALVIGGVGLVWPAAVATYHRAWVASLRPLHRLVSLILLAVVYYFVVTPIGLFLRLFRRKRVDGWQTRNERPLVEHLWKMW